MYMTEVVKMYLNDCVFFLKNFNRKQTECSYFNVKRCFTNF